jgi:hypothetical protein
VAVLTAFHLKKQVVVAFLDITGAYDNVLIDILSERIPIPLVFLLWDMMWEKHLYFFNGQDVAFMYTGYKGGSVRLHFEMSLNLNIWE